MYPIDNNTLLFTSTDDITQFHSQGSELIVFTALAFFYKISACIITPFILQTPDEYILSR